MSRVAERKALDPCGPRAEFPARCTFFAEADASKQALRDFFEGGDYVVDVLFLSARSDHEHGGPARQIVAVRETFSFIRVIFGERVFRESPGPPAGGNASLVDETEVVEEPVKAPFLKKRGFFPSTSY